ncbi:MAG TPA: hypothetical protein VMT12_17090 [Syntrophales bacterium]|nr:hypothetical protein [Syntrophales bacterium]
MKKNLEDYRKEMNILKARSESAHKEVTPETNHTNYPKREVYFRKLFPNKWVTLMPGLMAILMAILTLIFLIISEVLKRD